MKILAIRFENLNSLAGSWEIDLTVPDFANAGIFAIVGATGSGKSTLLDAVSLALYGRTPRIRQISKSTNDLMTHNQGHCSAELEFISSRGHFRCHWSQHRARRQPTGELQQPRHEISEAETGKILETKMKDVARKVLEVTGMDFDQFTRSMLLAQGEFNKFLQASADDRAPILEQITGTEIYSRVSIQVHELTGKSKQQLDLLRQELSGYKLLTREEENNLTSQLQELAGLVGKLQKTQQELQDKRNWQLSVQKLTKASEQLQHELEALAKSKLEFAPHQHRLEKAAAANNISGCYRQLKELTQQQVADEQSAADLKLQLEELAKSIAGQKANTEPLQQRYQKAADEYKNGQLLLREVAQLDQLISRQKKETLEQQQQLEANKSEITAKLQTIEELRQKRQAVGENGASARNYLEEHHIDRELLAELSGLRQLIKSLLQTEKEITALHTSCRKTSEKLAQARTTADALKKTTAKSAAALQTAEKSVENQRQVVARMPSLNELFTIREKLLEEFRETQLKLNLCKELRALETERKRLVTNLADGKQKLHELANIIEQQTRELQQQQELVEREQEIVLLAAKIKNIEQERQQLREGLPCPLCGSTSHPYLSTKAHLEVAPPDKRLQTSREKLESCRNRREESRNLLTRLELRQTNDTQKMEELAIKIQAGEQQLTANDAAPDDALPFHEALAHKGNELQRLLAQQQSKIEQREQQETNLGQVGKHFDDMQQEHRKQEKACENILLQIENLTEQQQTQDKEVARRQESYTSELHALQARYPDYAAVEPTPQAIQSVFSKLETRSQRYEKAKQQYEHSLQEDKTLLHTLETCSSVLTELQTATSRLQAKAEEHSQEMQLTKQRRMQLFADKSVEQEEKRLQQQLESTDKALRQHQLLLSDLEKQLATTGERQKLCTTTISSRSQQITAQRKEFISLLEQNEFLGEEHFLTSILPEEEFRNLARQAQELERQISRTQTLLARTSEELQEERDRKLCDIALPALEQQIEEQHSILAEKLQQKGALQRTLEDHQQALATYQDRQHHLSELEKDYGYWWRLHSLIGSADGKKFRNFAQGITFELMIRHANRQLVRMSDRYILVRSNSSPLDLQVVDNYQGGETRTTANLSGGESFIVSLALALGLASMAGNNIRVDTLFLDEGFGTLDEDALEVALDTLSSLHQEGKLIGIISHVHLLRDRIGTQLQLTTGQNGRSFLAGPGVKRL